MADPFIGEIRIFAGNFAIRDWAFCDGSLLQISQFTALFAVLGTTFGGDGQTTLGLPNLQGRVAMGAGNGPGLSNRQLGVSGGTQTETLAAAQLPGHTHTLRGVDADAQTTNPSGGRLATSNEDNYAETLAPNTPMSSLAKGNFAGQSHNNMQPYQVLNYLIALNGQFPSQS